MESGKLRHIITIEKLSDGTSDGMGNNIQSWEAVYTNIPALVSPISAKEAFIGEKNQIAISHRITMRYAPNVDSDCRIVFGTRVFSIQGVINPDERNIELMIGAKEATQ